MRYRTRTAPALICGFLIPAMAASMWAAESPDAAGGSIEGRVIHGVSQQPLPRAQVTASAPDGREVAAVASDEAGKFAIRGLPPGVYRLRATRTGFVANEYGAARPGGAGASLRLARGQLIQEVEVRLAPQGAIAGRVLDDQGEPAPNADVYCFEHGRHSGRRLLPISGTTTNDLGEFRIAGLAPGRYLIGVAFPSRRGPPLATDAAEDYVPTYYPGTVELSGAAPIEVGPGGDVRGIEVVPRRGPVVPVRGRVICPGEPPACRTAVRLSPRGVAFLGGRSAVADGRDGSFEITGVSPGSYLLTAQTTATGGRLSAQLAVEVGPAPVQSLELVLSPPFSLTGKVVLEGPQNAGGRDRLHLTLQPAGAFLPAARASVRGDGTFTFEGLGRDLYDLRVTGLPENYYLKLLRFGNVELQAPRLPLDESGPRPVELVLGRGGQVEGTVLGDREEPAWGLVALFPEGAGGSALRAPQVVETDAFGRFTFHGVAPGDYRLAAWNGSNADRDGPDLLDLPTGPGMAGEPIRVREDGGSQVRIKLAQPAGK